MAKKPPRVKPLFIAKPQLGKAEKSGSSALGPRLARIAHATLYEKVYQELRDALMNGLFVPGEVLTIRGVADALGTSVMPVREALHQLSAEGGVEILANRTIRVPLLDEASFDELVQMRLLLEGRAVGMAAERVTLAELEEINRGHVAFAEPVELPATSRLMANRQFHFSIYRAAKSPLLLSLIEMMWLQSGPCLMAPMQWHANRGVGSEYFDGGVRHHQELIGALTRHDGAAAAEAVQADIRDAAQAYRDVLAVRGADVKRVSGQ